MKSQFSETQFTVAFLHNIFSYCDNLGWRYSFIMPTQIEEYNVGYDAAIQLNYGMQLNCEVQPLYFQFKISEYLCKNNAKEYSDFWGPYYRFKIWPANRSPQHNKLVELSQDESFVAYCAPLFYSIQKFNDYQQNILDHSVMVPCRQLLKNSGDDRHVITYIENSDVGYWHSKRKYISVIHGFQLGKSLDSYKTYKNVIDYIKDIIYNKGIKVNKGDMELLKKYIGVNEDDRVFLKKSVHKILHEIAKQFLMQDNLILILRWKIPR